MILSGVIVNAICSAFIMFLMTVSSARELRGNRILADGRLDIADAGLNGIVGVAALAACAGDFSFTRRI